MSDNGVDISSWGPAYVADPYPFLNRIREESPVLRVVYHGAPAWFVTRFDDAQAVYADPRLSADRANGSAELRAVPWIAGPGALGLDRNMVFLDPPTHTRLRRLVTKAFTARRVEELRPLVRQVTDRLLDDLLPRGEADFIAEFAVPLASEVIMTLVGVRLTEMAEFRHHSDVFISTDPADAARLPQSLAWIRAYIADLLESARAQPQDNLLGDLIGVTDEGDRLDEAELGSMLLLLLMAGFETTASLLGNGLLALMKHPDQLAALRQNPVLIPNAVEEMLRYDNAAVASLPRFATEDLTVGGVPIRKGEAVIVSWAAANHDPSRFSQADSFDITRSEGSHIAFAHGIHYCLGAPLARMELQIAFAGLIQRCQAIELAVPEAELVWRVTPNIRGLAALPVHVS